MVGLGLNVGWAPPGAARLGDGIEPLDVLAVMLAAYDELPGDVFERYRSRLVTLGPGRAGRAAGRRHRGPRRRRRTGRSPGGARPGGRSTPPGHRRRGSPPPAGMTRSARDPQLAWPPVSRSRLRRPPGAIALGLAVLVGAVGSAGVLVAARDRSDDVERVPDVARGAAGAEQRRPGRELPARRLGHAREHRSQRPERRRLRRQRRGRRPAQRHDHGPAARAQRRRRCCSASRATSSCRSPAGAVRWTASTPPTTTAPEVLAADDHRGAWASRSTTTSRSTSSGFQRLVDAIGGVEICVDFATQDLNSGLHLNPGCQTLDGAQGLAYARSRHYQEFRDGDWQEDPRADLGRIERQQQFIRLAVAKLLQQVQADPFSLNGLLEAATDSVLIDESTRSAAGGWRLEGGGRGGRPADVRAAGRRRRDRRQVGRRAGATGRRRSWTSSVASRHRLQRRPPTTVPGCIARHEGVDPRRRRRHPAAADHAYPRQAARAGRQHADPLLRDRGDGRRRDQGHRRHRRRHRRRGPRGARRRIALRRVVHVPPAGRAARAGPLRADRHGLPRLPTTS